MKKSLALMAVVATLLAVLPSIPQAQTGAVIQQVEVKGHRLRFNGNLNDPAVVRYILIDPGNADPDVESAGRQVNTGSPNFLARNRYHFAAEGFVVAVVDAANDFNAHSHLLTMGADGSLHGSGLRGHRLPDRQHGGKHLADLAAVMSSLRANPRYSGLPVWAVGNSRGTVSAAVTALAVNPPADGVVLTAALTTADDAEEGLRYLDLESVRAPVLIVTHQDESCRVTLPEGSEALKDRFSASSRVHLMRVSGGSAPVSDPCDPLSPHGFFGIDQKVVDAITKWIKHSEH